MKSIHRARALGAFVCGTFVVLAFGSSDGSTNNASTSSPPPAPAAVAPEPAPPPPPTPEQEAQNAQLLASHVVGARQHCQTAEQHLDARRWADARGAAAAAAPAVTALRAAASMPEGGQEVVDHCVAVTARVAPYSSALDAVAHAEQTLAGAGGDADPIGVEDACNAAISRLDAVPSDVARRLPEVRRTRGQLQRRARQVHRAADRARRAIAAAAAQRARCGAAPLVGGWDGELVGSESYVARNVARYNPDDADVESCTQPLLSPDTRFCWLSRCTVRLTNLFGVQANHVIVFEVQNRQIVAHEVAQR